MRPQTSILRTLSRRSFRANRWRNLVAILAIILTTMMFTSLFVLSQSMIENMQQMYIQQAGYSSQLSSSLLTDDEADAIAAHPAVTKASRSIVVGVAENVSGRQVELRAASADYADSALSLPTEGRMPENADEIALDTITLDKLGLAHQLGETVHLSWTSVPGSDAHETADFILCGIWQGNPAAMASMAWVSEDFAEKLSVGVDQNAARESGSILGLTMLHIDLVDDSDPSGTAEKILADTGLSERVTLSPNIAYDSAVGQNMLRELLPMAICMVLVFVSGYLIIYNIFQISVAADIRFYGRLKTLGATKRQLKKIIYSQARRLCLVGIPFGLVIGYFLGAVLVPFMITSTGGAATVALDPWIFLRRRGALCRCHRAHFLSEASAHLWQGFADGSAALHRRGAAEPSQAQKEPQCQRPRHGLGESRAQSQAHRARHRIAFAGAGAFVWHLREKRQLRHRQIHERHRDQRF